MTKIQMAKQKGTAGRKTKRSVGRPRTTGPGVQINVRWHADFLIRLDAWRAHRKRPQAIKELAEIGLDHEENHQD